MVIIFFLEQWLSAAENQATCRSSISCRLTEKWGKLLCQPLWPDDVRYTFAYISAVVQFDADIPCTLNIRILRCLVCPSWIEGSWEHWAALQCLRIGERFNVICYALFFFDCILHGLISNQVLHKFFDVPLKCINLSEMLHYPFSFLLKWLRYNKTVSEVKIFFLNILN